MSPVNTRRVALGALVGAVVWFLWSSFVNDVILKTLYADAQASGELLKEPRYHLFVLYWFVTLLVVSYVLAWLYAGVRATYGAGPNTALKAGIYAGFAIAFPLNLTAASWEPISRKFPLWWMLDLWVGAILSTFVAAWLYRD